MLRKKLEVKVLAVVVLLFVIATLVIGSTVITLQRQGLENLAHKHTDSISNLVTSTVEVAMKDGRPEVAKDMVRSLYRSEGIEDIRVLSWEGRAAFDATAPNAELDALERLRKDPVPYLEQEHDTFVYYNPMINGPECQQCHGTDKHVIGAVKVTISASEVYGNFGDYVLFAVVGSILGVTVLSFAVWLALRRMVLKPVQEIRQAARRLSQGDLTFDIGIEAEDEIGEMAVNLKNSVRSVGTIVSRIGELAGRTATVTNGVEQDSKKILEGTKLEADAIANISSSIEELNVSISGIAESVDSLSSSAEETSASVAQMAASTEQVAQSAMELSSTVETASSSIEQMSSTIKEVAKGAEELAATADETTSAVEEIGAAVKEVESNARDAANMSQGVKEAAEGAGLTSVQRTIDGMTRIRVAVQKAAGYITRLGGRSEEIGQILTVIEEITDQTTLLALNAAILAAQAGEHGKGFSVVADEIKSLADRTSGSTKEIVDLIEAVQTEVAGAVTAMDDGLKRVDEGLRLSDEAGTALNHIVESAVRSTAMASSIERSTTEQAKSVLLVSGAMGRVQEMVRHIARATAEQNKGANLIMNSTEKVRDISQHLKTATFEQSKGSRQISDAVETVSERIGHIASAIKEQKKGSDLIMGSIERIREIPKSNRLLAFTINKGLKKILQDTELLETEGARFRTRKTEDERDTVAMGVVPLEAPAEMFRKFSPLAEYLGEKLGMRIDLRVPVDFEGAIREVGRGQTRICFMTPSTYIRAHEEYGVTVVAKALRNGKPVHHAVIAVKEGSPYHAVAELRGRSFAFGDTNSTSSHIMPRAMLLDEGIRLGDLAFYDYLGHHDDVAQAVLNGSFEAGGLMELVAVHYVPRGLRIIRVSEEIPEFNICVNKDFPAEARGRLLAALEELGADTEKNQEVLHTMDPEYTGFEASSDKDYDGIRSTMARVEKEAL